MSDIIYELETNEEEWWAGTIQEFRLKYIKEPKQYARTIIEKKGITKKQLAENIDKALFDIREAVWQLYLIDEALFHSEVLSHLIKTRDLPKSLLLKIIDSQFMSQDYEKLTKTDLSGKIADIVGDYTGRIMPYIYSLGLSTTQSRRARAGKTFEHIIETFMDIFEYPYEDQAEISKSQENLGKKVDLIVPSMKAYNSNRSKSAVITMKTTLRERWQEVAEELSRTNIPHIYLLTIDGAITTNVVDTMKRYNITVVVYGPEKRKKFIKQENVQDFNEFFLKEMPHIISYWKNKS